MKQEYLNCKLGLTPQCPNLTEPAMRKMLVPTMDAGKPVATFDDTDIEAANRLCAKCNVFTPFPAKEGLQGL